MTKVFASYQAPNLINYEKCQIIMKKYKKKVDYLFFNISYSHTLSIEGVCSNLVNSKEFEINKTINNIFIKIIHQNREIIFNCNDVEKLDQELKLKIKQLKEFAEDMEVVIPASAKIFVEDDNVFCSSQNINEVFQRINTTFQDVYPKFFNFIIANLTVQTSQIIAISMDSHDFIHGAREISCNLITDINTKDNHQKKYSIFGYHKVNSFDTIEKFFTKELQCMKNQIGAEPITTGVYDCIFLSKISSAFFGSLLSLFSGELIANQSSYYKNSLYQQILPSDISIIDNPKSQYGTYSYDGEGIKLEKKFVIESGVLKTFILNNRYAKKLRMAPTGGRSNVFIEGKNYFDIKNLINGVIIEQIIDDNFNKTSGEYKGTCSGVVLNNGQAKPFNNAVVSFTLQDLMRLQLVNDEIYTDYNVFVSSMYIPQITISGL